MKQPNNKFNTTQEIKRLKTVAEEALVANALTDQFAERKAQTVLVTKIKKLPAKWKAILAGVIVSTAGFGVTLSISPEARKYAMSMKNKASDLAIAQVKLIADAIQKLRGKQITAVQTTLRVPPPPAQVSSPRYLSRNSRVYHSRSSTR
jgi:hypothetical protein